MDSIIHIGYPKTGTTFFQNQIFPFIKDSYNATKQEIFKQIIKPNPFIFNPDLTNKYFLEKNNKKLIISYERLIGSSQDGGLNLLLSKTNAEKIKQVFPDAQIVVFIRNQIDMIASTYCQYIYGGGTYNVNNFIYGRFFPGPNSLKIFNFDFFKYNLLIRFYIQLFGHKNVHIYLYEDFKTNIEKFIGDFLKELNLKIKNIEISYDNLNPSYSSVIIPLARFLNRFTRRASLNKNYYFHIPGWYEYSRRFLNTLNKCCENPEKNNTRNMKILGPKLINHIESYYKKSNQYLGNYVGIDKLREYNYPL